MKATRTIIPAIVTAVALAAAGISYAQPYGAMGYGMGPRMGMGPGHGPAAAMNPEAMADAHLGNLKAQLKITTGQEDAWQTFVTQAKQQAATMQTMRAQMQAGTGTAPERMAQHTAAMQQRAAGMATMTDAFTALYAVLTPEQKTIADQNVGMMGHRWQGFSVGRG